MADHDYRNQTLGYAQPARSGSARGALVLVAGIIALFFLGMLFMGEGGAPTVAPDPAAVPADAAVPSSGTSQ